MARTPADARHPAPRQRAPLTEPAAAEQAGQEPVTQQQAGQEQAWLDPLELAAWIGLIKLSARIVSLSDGELRRRHGITGRDYELLHHLSETAGPRRVNELAEVIDDSSSGITHRVNRLVDAGLVAKCEADDDRRSRLVTLTAAGRGLLDAAAPGHAARVRSWVIDPLSRRDLQDLARVAGKLGVHLRQVAPEER